MSDEQNGKGGYGYTHDKYAITTDENGAIVQIPYVIATPTIHLRFLHGKLQQQFYVAKHEGDCMEWRNVEEGEQ